MIESFGTRFGALIKTKRGIEGLTQQKLAVAAFGNEDQKTRVSELENGKVPNPQQKTIDALVLALNISPEELRACRTPVPDAGLPPLLLKGLAFDFGHQNPDAKPTELESFLAEKAADYRALKARLDALVAGDKRIANLAAAAQAALDNGDFTEARALIDDAIQMQLAERLLPQLRLAAGLHSLKAESYLLDGDVALAVASYETGAALFSGVAPKEGAKLFHNSVLKIYEHGLRYNSQGLEISIELFRRVLSEMVPDDDLVRWSDTQNNFAAALLNKGKRLGAPSGLVFFFEAMNALQASIGIDEKLDRKLEKAEKLSNLAFAYSHLGLFAEPPENIFLLRQAVGAMQAILEVHTHNEYPVEWAAAQHNLSVSLLNLSRKVEGPERLLLSQKAVDACHAALTVRTQEFDAEDWAATQNNLGSAQHHNACLLGGLAGIAILDNARVAYHSALLVYTKAAHPVDWAMTQENLGILFATLAEFQPENAVTHLQVALFCFDLSLQVFDPVTMPFNFQKASASQALAIAALAALKSG